MSATRIGVQEGVSDVAAAVVPDAADDSQKTVTIENVRYVAQLANLELTEAEMPAIERDLNAILGYIAQLNELDTTGVPAMAQVGEMLGGSRAAAGEELRVDAVRASVNRAEVMAAAPETDGRFFKVPKVIER